MKTKVLFTVLILFSLVASSQFSIGSHVGVEQRLQNKEFTFSPGQMVFYATLEMAYQIHNYSLAAYGTFPYSSEGDMENSGLLCYYSMSGYAMGVSLKYHLKRFGFGLSGEYKNEYYQTFVRKSYYPERIESSYNESGFCPYINIDYTVVRNYVKLGFDFSQHSARAYIKIFTNFSKK